MVRYTCVAVLSVGLWLMLVLLVRAAVAGVSADRAPVYDVTTVRAQLANDPAHWLGRTVLVRGEVVPCLPMPSAEHGLCAALAPYGWQPASPTPGRATIDPLPVVHAGLDPLLARLHVLPLLGTLVPAPQVLQWGTVGTYRVRLRASANSMCGTGPCYEAQLLDADQTAM